MCFSRSLHFFFQAEDGIRDTSVTGVQTCALPICPARTRNWAAVASPSGSRMATATRPGCFCGRTLVSKIGRASCRERVWIAVMDASFNENYADVVLRCEKHQQDQSKRELCGAYGL